MKASLTKNFPSVNLAQDQIISVQNTPLHLTHSKFKVDCYTFSGDFTRCLRLYCQKWKFCTEIIESSLLRPRRSETIITTVKASLAIVPIHERESRHRRAAL